MGVFVVGKVEIDEEDLSFGELKVMCEFDKDGVLNDGVMEVLKKVMVSKRVGGSGGSGGKEGVESKSSKIRKLSKEGMSKGEIGKLLDIRYEFVYNVLRREELNELGKKDKELKSKSS